jgi:hypothetical protein
MSTNSTIAGTIRSGGYLDHAGVGFDRAKGVILSRDARFGQGVEQGGFANVGQTHDAAFQTHKNIPCNWCRL